MDNTDPYKTKFKEERLYMSTNQNLMQHMRELIDRIKAADVAYYRDDNPTMTDREYDLLVDELKELETTTGLILSGSPTQTEINLFKVRPGNDAFTSHLKFVCTGNAHWHIHKGADGMCHIFTDNALTASGDCLLELSTFVAEDKCQAIQFPRKHHRPAVCKPKHLINGLCFIR